MTDEEFARRYEALAHAIQSGTAHEHALGSKDQTPKHLRVGITLGRLEHAAVARLCIAAGLFTESQYFEAVIAELEREKALLEERLTRAHGGRARISLA